ncbi:MAG: hypothetical protein AAF490_14210 [Chloroflexota bacterium]
MSIVTVGDSAPRIKEKAFPTNLAIVVPSETQTPTLLVFVGYQTATKIEGVVSNIRRIIPNPESLLIINVVGLKNVPRLMKGTAKKIIQASYDQAAKQIPEGHDPATQLILLTDWKGKIMKAYGVGDVSEHLALIMIDENGRISHRYQGPEPVTEAMEMVMPLIRK